MLRLLQISSQLKRIPRNSFLRPLCVSSGKNQNSNENDNSNDNVNINNNNDNKADESSQGPQAPKALKKPFTHESDDDDPPHQDFRDPQQILREVFPDLTKALFDELIRLFPDLSPKKGKLSVALDSKGRPIVVHKKGGLTAKQIVAKVVNMQKELEELLPKLAPKFPLLVSREPEFLRMKSLRPSFEKVADLFGKEESLRIISTYPRALILSVVASGHALSSPTKLEEKFETLSEALGHDEALGIIHKDPFVLSKNAERTTKVRIEILETALQLPKEEVIRVIQAVPELLYERQNRVERLRCELPPFYASSSSSSSSSSTSSSSSSQEGDGGDEMVSREINPEFLKAVSKYVKATDSQLMAAGGLPPLRAVPKKNEKAKPAAKKPAEPPPPKPKLDMHPEEVKAEDSNTPSRPSEQQGEEESESSSSSGEATSTTKTTTSTSGSPRPRSIHAKLPPFYAPSEKVKTSPLPSRPLEKPVPSEPPPKYVYLHPEEAASEDPVETSFQFDLTTASVKPVEQDPNKPRKKKASLVEEQKKEEGSARSSSVDGDGEATTTTPSTLESTRNTRTTSRSETREQKTRAGQERRETRRREIMRNVEEATKQRSSTPLSEVTEGETPREKKPPKRGIYREKPVKKPVEFVTPYLFSRTNKMDLNVLTWMPSKNENNRLLRQQARAALRAERDKERDAAIREEELQDILANPRLAEPEGGRLAIGDRDETGRGGASRKDKKQQRDLASSSSSSLQEGGDEDPYDPALWRPLEDGMERVSPKYKPPPAPGTKPKIKIPTHRGKRVAMYPRWWPKPRRQENKRLKRASVNAARRQSKRDKEKAKDARRRDWVPPS